VVRNDEREAAMMRLGVICLTLFATALNSERAWKLSFDSMGPVRIGMTVPRAQKALHFKLSQNLETGGDEDCYYVDNKRSLPGISFMVIAGTIQRIDVDDRTYQTTLGARVGMTEDEIKRLYPALRVEPHQYIEDGHYFIVDHERFSLLFETDGKVVTGIRAGLSEPVGYVEGCV
jgi:hypothetical protein